MLSVNAPTGDPYAELRGKAKGVTAPTDMTVETVQRAGELVSARRVWHRRSPGPLRRPPRNNSRRNNGRTRRSTRRVTTSARRTRSGARSSPSDLADGSEPADGSAHQLDLTRSSRRRAS
jgi:hypothetical protein